MKRKGERYKKGNAFETGMGIRVLAEMKRSSLHNEAQKSKVK
jgi:hypothetical protein